MSNWVAHYSAEGRPYWFNSESKESVWEKPRELQSAVEIELGNLNWKEYETKGRKYWVHNVSKETTWEMPAEVRGKIQLQPINLSPG
jgi:pre-mRNA-processing factor 40